MFEKLIKLLYNTKKKLKSLNDKKKFYFYLINQAYYNFESKTSGL